MLFNEATSFVYECIIKHRRKQANKKLISKDKVLQASFHGWQQMQFTTEYQGSFLKADAEISD